MSSCRPSGEEEETYCRVSSIGPQRWWWDWSMSPIKKGCESWGCLACKGKKGSLRKGLQVHKYPKAQSEDRAKLFLQSSVTRQEAESINQNTLNLFTYTEENFLFFTVKHETGGLERYYTDTRDPISIIVGIITGNLFYWLCLSAKKKKKNQRKGENFLINDARHRAVLLTSSIHQSVTLIE